MSGRRIFVVASLLLTLAACSRKEEKKDVELITFGLRGEVVSIEPERRRIVIAHEEIPDYMKAMTMPFKVKDSTLLAGIQPGDSVQGTLAVSRTESWLETLSVIGHGEAPRALRPEEIGWKRLFREEEPMPDFAFVNQDGRRVRFSDFRGKVLAFTMIYTRCPIPDFCIRMSDFFSKVQKRLKQERDLAGKWHLMTVSFDPEFDTPEVLKKYGTTYGADFTTWDFVTDTHENIFKLADGLDMTIADDEGGLIAHNLRTVLIAPDGRLVEIIKGNEWTPEEIVAKIRALAKTL